MSAVPLPRDASLVELRPDSPNALPLFSRSTGKADPKLVPLDVVRKRFLELVTFDQQPLVMEGGALPLEALAEACLVVARDRNGYVFHSRLSLAGLTEGDRSLIALFIAKGRGSPTLGAPEVRH